jgi:hypothetical protein
VQALEDVLDVEGDIAVNVESSDVQNPGETSRFSEPESPGDSLYSVTPSGQSEPTSASDVSNRSYRYTVTTSAKRRKTARQKSREEHTKRKEKPRIIQDPLALTESDIDALEYPILVVSRRQARGCFDYTH